MHSTRQHFHAISEATAQAHKTSLLPQRSVARCLVGLLLVGSSRVFSYGSSCLYVVAMITVCLYLHREKRVKYVPTKL